MKGMPEHIKTLIEPYSLVKINVFSSCFFIRVADLVSTSRERGKVKTKYVSTDCGCWLLNGGHE